MKFRFALLAFLVVPGAALGAGGEGANAPAASASGLNLAMTLYAGGVTLGKVDLDATIRGGEYHAVSNLETSGIVNAFWQAQIQATSNGKIAGTALKPALYDSFDTNHSGKKQEVSLTYENEALPRMYANPKFPNNGYEVKPEDQKATFDPLSAVVMIFAAASAENPCGITVPVFDGRRRYNVELSKVKETAIKMDNGLYKGRGLLCEIRYKQLAGFKPHILKENENFPKINAWIATFPSTVPGRSYAVPLRVWADTQYGVVAAVATTLKIDGAAPKS